MLVLTRKPGQSVYIGDDIKITLHGIKGNQVRIGVEAPDNVRIYREEIYLQILEENQSAASWNVEAAKGDLNQVAEAWREKRPRVVLDAVESGEGSGEPDDEVTG